MYHALNQLDYEKHIHYNEERMKKNTKHANTTCYSCCTKLPTLNSDKNSKLWLIK